MSREKRERERKGWGRGGERKRGRVRRLESGAPRKGRM